MKAYELLDSREKWCQGLWARDVDGKATLCQGPNAIAWCVQGAIVVCYGARAFEVVDQLHEHISPISLPFGMILLAVPTKKSMRS